MFGKFKKPGKISFYKIAAEDYAERILRGSRSEAAEPDEADTGLTIKYSCRTPAGADIRKDRFDSGTIGSFIKKGMSVDEISAALSRNLNLSFVDKLIQYIDAQGLKDSAVYKAAGIDRRLFSKIISDRGYRPSKDTAVALALALKLSLFEAEDFLSRAGYVLSHSSKRDIIIEYFIKERVYDLGIINEVLYSLGEKTLGR